MTTAAGDGKDARSIVHVHAYDAGTGGAGDAGPLCVVTVELLTGRQHQIRVHCAQSLGAPIANDEAYGGARLARLHRSRPLLHAWAMEVPALPSPTTRDAPGHGGARSSAAPLSLHAPLPEDMRALLDERFPSLGDDPARWPLHSFGAT